MHNVAKYSCKMNETNPIEIELLDPAKVEGAHFFTFPKSLFYIQTIIKQFQQTNENKTKVS